MQQMWSPWRAQHVKRASTDALDDEDRSLFARLADEDNDEENLILWRGNDVFVILNRYPYNNGHLMIVPYREVAAYEDLTPDEQVEIAFTLARCLRWIRSALNPDGFNVGMNLGAAAGAGLPRHLHLHIVPRWSGDTNFMPTIGETKVIPEALSDTYRKLRAAMEQDEENTRS